MQRKIIATAIITIVTFLGLESLSLMIGLNQESAFRTTAVYVYLFHVFWIAFLFDLHLKHRAPVDLTSAKMDQLVRQALVTRFRHFTDWNYFRHFVNYFVLPTILFWSAVVLMYINPFSEIKQIVIVGTTVAYALNYWYMKVHLSSRLESRSAPLKLLSTAKLFTAFQAYAAVIGASWYFGFDSNIVFYYLIAITFFLIHQAIFSYNLHHTGLFIGTIGVSIVLAWLGVWVYNSWTYQYFTGALILLAIYNTVWGLMHHYLDKTFTSKLALEYIVFGLLVISIVFATHNFRSQLI